MKTLFLSIAILCAASISFAVTPAVWKSSNTAAATTTLRVLCNENQKGIFHGVCTGFGVAASSVAVVASTWTYNAGTIIAGPVTTLVADQCKYYDITANRGLSFFKNNTATITIMYECY